VRKHIIFTLCVLLVLGVFVGCKDTNKKDGRFFRAIVLEKDESNLLVKPDDGSSELASADRIAVFIGEATLIDAKGKEITIEEIEEGNKVQIFYDGAIAESYPAQIYGCYKVALSE